MWRGASRRLVLVVVALSAGSAAASEAPPIVSACSADVPVYIGAVGTSCTATCAAEALQCVWVSSLETEACVEDAMTMFGQPCVSTLAAAQDYAPIKLEPACRLRVQRRLLRQRRRRRPPFPAPIPTSPRAPARRVAAGQAARERLGPRLGACIK